MRTETSEANWRVRLGDRARQLVLSVMPEDGKPDGELLEKALAQIDQDKLLAEARAEVLETCNARLAPVIERFEQSLSDVLSHNALMLGIVYRQLYTCRQVLALIDAPNDAIGTVIEKSLEVLRHADETYRRLVPEAERRYPDFDQKLENAFVEKLDAANRAKASDKARTPGKDEEKVL